MNSSFTKGDEEGNRFQRIQKFTFSSEMIPYPKVREKVKKLQDKMDLNQQFLLTNEKIYTQQEMKEMNLALWMYGIHLVQLRSMFEAYLIFLGMNLLIWIVPIGFKFRFPNPKNKNQQEKEID